MSYIIKITPTAFNDLQQGISYYNSQQNGLGNKFKSLVDMLFSKLSILPTSGSFMYNEVRFKVIKKFPFIVLYEIHQQKFVAILRIFNSHQKPFWSI